MVGLAALSLLAFPLVASASVRPTGSAPPAATPVASPTSYLAPDLKQTAATKPNQIVSVIVQSTAGPGAAVSAVSKAMSGRKATVKQLGLIGGAVVDIPAARLNQLMTTPGLTITPDAPVRLSGADDAYDSTQVWPAETGNSLGWGTRSHPAPNAPTIAIIDSGIDANRADFDNGRRVVAQVNMTTLPGNSPGDGRGHGTFVAGVAAGSAHGDAGASPRSNIVMLDVMNDEGMARTSDVIRAAQWILANKNTYNIKVVNLSLHSTTPSNFTRDPLDRAVEQLWFAGVTVVVAAGNYGTTNGPSGVLFAPGNDPFVITVGALDVGKSPAADDDTTAPWSAYGYTYDGFMKPELSAPGRYMVGPVPAGSTLTGELRDHVVAPGYMQLSGTSFAAPIVAGTVAQMLAFHPTWTPGQVKGVLMATARKVSAANPKNAAGVGVVTAAQAVNWNKPTLPNPNSVLDRYVRTDWTGARYFDAGSWYSAARSNPTWDAAAFQDVSWHDVSWQDVSWSNVSWHDVSWNDVSGDDSDGDSAREDAAEGDANATGGVYITPDQLAQALCDPYLNPYPATTCSHANPTAP